MRAQRPAPRIDGLTYVKELGAGGFADVYLYRSDWPKRDVAVKVLREHADHAKVARFIAEANTMARLQGHPYIVSVFRAGTAGDGRPYIEMEYYLGGTFADRIKQGPLPVDEVLRVGVQLASAVETAHRAGILHKDIKPGNVLRSKYDDPVLTDFGIASALGRAEADEGLSVPWSPPEVIFGTAPADARADVYSLAASLWQFLTGRAPYQSPTGTGSVQQLVARTRDMPAPTTTGRADVPAELERALSRALNKDPIYRPQSAADFGVSLQNVEQRLNLSVTPLKLEVIDEPGRRAPSSTAAGPHGKENLTRLRTELDDDTGDSWDSDVAPNPADQESGASAPPPASPPQGSPPQPGGSRPDSSTPPPPAVSAPPPPGLSAVARVTPASGGSAAPPPGFPAVARVTPTSGGSAASPPGFPAVAKIPPAPGVSASASARSLAAARVPPQPGGSVPARPGHVQPGWPPAATPEAVQAATHRRDPGWASAPPAAFAAPPPSPPPASTTMPTVPLVKGRAVTPVSGQRRVAPPPPPRPARQGGASPALVAAGVTLVVLALIGIIVVIVLVVRGDAQSAPPPTSTVAITQNQHYGSLSLPPGLVAMDH